MPSSRRDHTSRRAYVRASLNWRWEFQQEKRQSLTRYPSVQAWESFILLFLRLWFADRIFIFFDLSCQCGCSLWKLRSSDHFFNSFMTRKRPPTKSKVRYNFRDANVLRFVNIAILLKMWMRPQVLKNKSMMKSDTCMLKISLQKHLNMLFLHQSLCSLTTINPGLRA